MTRCLPIVPLLSTAALLLAALPGVVAADIIEVTGEARAPDDGTLLYTEQHLLRHDGDTLRERLVLYRCPDGRPFAQKAVSYGELPQAPQFELRDQRFGYVEGYRDGEAFVRRSAEADRQRDAVKADALVVDAGFDEFVRANWDALQAGDTLPLDFLVPSRLDAYRFKLRRLRSEAVFGAPATVFRLQLSGPLGWFADAIDATYRDSDRRLLRFEGLSNIRRTPDDNLVARIEFAPDRERAVDATAWQAAGEQPLADCTVGG